MDGEEEVRERNAGKLRWMERELTPPDLGSLTTLILDEGPPNMRCISMCSFSWPTTISTLTEAGDKDAVSNSFHNNGPDGPTHS